MITKTQLYDAFAELDPISLAMFTDGSVSVEFRMVYR